MSPWSSRTLDIDWAWAISFSVPSARVLPRLDTSEEYIFFSIQYKSDIRAVLRPEKPALITDVLSYRWSHFITKNALKYGKKVEQKNITISKIIYFKPDLNIPFYSYTGKCESFLCTLRTFNKTM